MPKLTTFGQLESTAQAVHGKIGVIAGTVADALTEIVESIPAVSDSYSPTSSDAMSGKGVAAALATATGSKVEPSTTNGNIILNGIETNVYTHPSGTNPHGTTKSDVGLSEVENKSSATIRSELEASDVTMALTYTPAREDVATTSKKGLMSSADKSKLNGIAEGATANVGTLTGISMNGESKGTSGVVDLGDVITSHQVIKIDGQVQPIQDGAVNLPAYPIEVTESTVEGWGFTKNTGTYSKPSTGIPKTDLSTSVQSSLDKADSALQSYTEKYTGTYSKPSGGIPKTDLSSAVQASLGKADTSIQSLDGYATEQYVDDAIEALPSPMVFKGSLGTGGTITSLPSASSSNEGFTYKVITDGTYASQTARIGDVFISNGSSWILVPSGDDPSGDGTVTSVGVSVPTGLKVTGSPITTSGTIAITMATGYSIPTTSKQSAWDGKQSALSADQLAATNSGITKDIVDAIPSSYAPIDAQANVIETIKVNGTAQTVTSKSVDITVPTKASDIGAMASTVTHLSGDVPTTRTVNGKALSSNITLSASDVGALPDTTSIPEILYGTSEPTSTQGKDGDIYIKIIS